jgi:hypothetical protein
MLDSIDQAGAAARPRPECGGVAHERGSAMLISLMVMVILTLLGIAYLLMAETENMIAVNERNAGQVLYMAENGARAAVEWFNNPVGGFSLPASGDVDRTLRRLDLDNNGTWETVADGTAGKERYRQTTNLLFQKPYRSALEDTFLGSEDYPDIRITAGTFLTNLNSRILGTGAGTPADPDPEATYGRISQIDFYAPPIIVVSGARVRHGVATIKVTAQKVKTIGGVDRVLAERTIKVVLNEINYPSAAGPLQSCSTTNWQGDFLIHWGTATVETAGDFNITGGGGAFNGKFPTGMAYGALSPTQYFADTTAFDNWLTANAGDPIEDPWYKILVGGFIDNIDSACGGSGTDPQPCPAAAYDGTWSATASHDNLFQDQGTAAACPDFDYAIFKNVAQRGGAGIYYYAYDSGANFKEGGMGAQTTFAAATDNKPGFFFFDTANGAPPDRSGSPCGTNCTPAISLSSSSNWGTGPDVFIYLNAASFGTTGGGSMGYQRTLAAPGEPYFDTNGDGDYDAGEPHVNITYDTANAYASFVIGTGGTRDAKGPDIPNVNDVILHGIFYMSGTFSPGGNGLYYGAVIAENVDTNATPDIFFNERILLDSWPPADSPVPKVYVSVWEVDNL